MQETGDPTRALASPQTSDAILALQKDTMVLGTYESSAFILSLRDREEFSTTTAFGYHSIPHIGVYGNDYTLALPMVLLSLPTTSSYLRKLPNDLLHCIELGCLASSSPLPLSPPTPQQHLTEHAISVLHSHSHLTPNVQLRALARELVNFVLNSACAKMRLSSICLFGGSLYKDNKESHFTDNFSRLASRQEKVEEMEQAGEQNFLSYRQGKRWRLSSGGSGEGMEQEVRGGVSFSVPYLSERRPSHRVSPWVEVAVIEEEEGSEEVEWSDEGMGGREEEELRMVAKRLVKKVLHLVCKKWESMNRRSSIDYLIASTKRLKIASPSPPPTVLEEGTEYEEGKGVLILQLPAEVVGRGGPSPVDDGGRRKKRNRSQSHDIMMMKELERFRAAQLGLGQQERTERQFAKPRWVTPWERDGISSHGRGGSPHLHPMEAVGSLISDIRQLSIAEMQSESGAEDGCSSSEEYTILSPITKPSASVSGSDSEPSHSPMPPPNSPTVLLPGKEVGWRPLSPLVRQTMASPVPPLLKGFDCHLIPQPVTSRLEELTTCTSPEFQEHLTVPPNLLDQSEPSRSVKEDIVMLGSHSSPAGLPSFFPGPPTLKLDYYSIIHSCPPPGLCQKFLCGNTDEVNLIYHCWFYPDAPCDPNFSTTHMLSMGVFSPQGVAPVHQNLQDAGVAFHHLHPRTVCIHSCSFSPENAQLRLCSGSPLHTFFSAAWDGSRKVVAFHVVPATQELERSLRHSLSRSNTLGELLQELSVCIPDTALLMRDLIIPELK